MNEIKNPDPVVSVVIATQNRADMLAQSINSVLAQTFKDFELIIVDDNSTDNTADVVKAFADSRIKYLKLGSSKTGISAARNAGASISRGKWTAVHDDDDLMLPRRLERQLEFAHEGNDFIFGAFINFDDNTGSLQLHHGRNMTYGAALQTGFAPGHSTWLVRTELIKKFGYDEGLESAVDNNLAFRLLRSGVQFEHSGVICLLRRVHSGRITDVGGQGQKYAAQLNLAYLRSGINAKSQKDMWTAARYDWGPVEKNNWETRTLPYLPDHLVARAGNVYKDTEPVNGDFDSLITVQSHPSISWDQWYQMDSEGHYLGEVHTRLVEDPLIEAMILKNQLSSVEDNQVNPDSQELHRAVYGLYKIQTSQENQEDFIACVVNGTSDAVSKVRGNIALLPVWTAEIDVEVERRAFDIYLIDSGEVQNFWESMESPDLEIRAYLPNDSSLFPVGGAEEKKESAK